MVKKISCLILISFCTIFCGINVKAQDVPDYLILADIGDYEFTTQIKDFITGQPKPTLGYTIRKAPGDLIATGHFYQDHADRTYETDYINVGLEIAVDVQIVQHTGSDSDQWLLHEIEDSYRDGDDKDGRLGLLSGVGVKIRDVGGNRFIYWGLGGGGYTWISEQKVIDISYTDLQRTKPEPFEIIQAYLAKFPSTLPATLVLDSAHEKQWIKDEVSRRLWLCDKWLAWQNAGNADVPKMVRAVVGHLNVFLDYRQKYYGIPSKDDKRALDGYMLSDNKPEIQKKLTEYKQWWAAHKNDSITLP